MLIMQVNDYASSYVYAHVIHNVTIAVAIAMQQSPLTPSGVTVQHSYYWYTHHDSDNIWCLWSFTCYMSSALTTW